MKRREIFSLMLAAVAAMQLYAMSSVTALAADPIVIGLPLNQTGPVGVVDHQDHLNGTMLAIEEINAAGGVLGRKIEYKVVDTDLLSPEGTQAAFQKLADEKVHAISSPFVLIPNPAMDASAAYGAPHMTGDTKIDAIKHYQSDPERFSNFFHLDPPEVNYGVGFVPFLDALKASGKWKPINNKIHIVQGQLAYNQQISKATQEAIKKSNGAWELAGISDIQSPIQDWGPTIRTFTNTAPASSCWTTGWPRPTQRSPVSIRPTRCKAHYIYAVWTVAARVLDIAGEGAEGYVWSTVLGVYSDEKGKEFRAKYKKRFPGSMGLVYTGMGYDVVYMLKNAWKRSEIRTISRRSTSISATTTIAA